MTDERPVVVKLASGAEYGLPSIAAAKRIYPNGQILKYQDGTSINPADLEDAGLTEQGEVEVSEKMTRDELEKIATGLNIEGADNKTAFATKADLVAEIQRVKAEAESAQDEPGGDEGTGGESESE